MREKIMKNRNKSTIKYTNKIRENKCAEIFQHTKTHSRIQWLFILARFCRAVPIQYIWPVLSHAWTRFVAFGSHFEPNTTRYRSCVSSMQWMKRDRSKCKNATKRDGTPNRCHRSSAQCYDCPCLTCTTTLSVFALFVRHSTAIEYTQAYTQLRPTERSRQPTDT